ncbi:uncharacterized protein LOC127706880 [Mytilus californianus]|uniref:uncharacterized protein LOC127706880 n=1 Tax=Mytilus californianus TaxID=6549 RepID=UPI00224795B3|nr:uncharacterized protein LOC127706880 [Mytilus californianus]
MHRGIITTGTRGQPMGGYPPPFQGFAPPGTGFAPPGSGYHPPGQGFAPPGTGFAPPGQGFSQPSPPAYPPPPYTQPPPPEQGYPPPPEAVYYQPKPVGIVVLPDNSGRVQRTPPPDWTVPAVIACIFCAWPCGLIAILSSRSAKKAHEQGDYISARTRADNAKKLIIFSVIVGLFCYVYIIYSQVRNVAMYD